MTSTAAFLGCAEGDTGTFSTASTTRYVNLSTCGVMGYTATEASVQFTARAAGDFSRIGCRLKTNTRTTADTVVFRKDTGGGGANGNNTFSVTASTTGWFEDATPHNDTVAVGDKFCLAFTSGTGSGNQVFTVFGAKFLASSGTNTTYYGFMTFGDSAGSSCLNFTTVNTNTRTYDTPFAGSNHNTAGSELSETVKWRVQVRGVGTIKNIHTRIQRNQLVAAGTFKIRINNADGNNTTSITAGTTGTFEDATPHSDGVASGDGIVWAWVLPQETAGHNLDTCFATGMFVGSGSAFDALSAWTGPAAGTGSTSANNYYSTYGYAQRFLTESDIQMGITLAVTASNIRVYFQQANTGALTFALRVGGFSVNNAASVTSGATGLFEDTVSTDSLSDGNQINYMHGPLSSIFGPSITYTGLKLDPGGGGSAPGNGSEVHHYNTVILG